LKLLTLHADTTSSGSEFHSLTILVTKKCLRRPYSNTTGAPVYIYVFWYYNFIRLY